VGLPPLFRASLDAVSNIVDAANYSGPASANHKHTLAGAGENEPNGSIEDTASFPAGRETT